jgi:MFS family permease
MISAWARNTFQSLSHPHYRMLWMGSTLAFMAFMMSFIVQSVVAFNLTGRNSAVGFVSLGMGIATITISPFGGVIADRVSKRKLLLIGQTLIGLNFAAVGALVITGQITIWLLAASTFVLGAVFAFIAPARQAWIGEILPPERIPNAIALQQMAMTATRIFGPFLAGGLIAIGFIGTGGTYMVMAGFFLLVVLSLTRLPQTRSRTRGTGPTVLADFKLGLRHINDNPRLRLLTISFIGVIMGGFSFQVILPGLLENELGRDPKDMSILLGASAVSGLIATIAIAGFAGSRHAWFMMTAAGITLGASLILTSLAPGFFTVAAVMLFVGIGSSAFQLLNNSIIMQEANPAYFGRVMSITMLAWGFNGLAAWPFGALADQVGERQTLLVMGVIVIGVMAATALAYSTFARRPAIARAELRPGEPEPLR